MFLYLMKRDRERKLEKKEYEKRNLNMREMIKKTKVCILFVEVFGIE